MDKPTLHLTNWSSRKLHGNGAKYRIMAKPRQWERGDGAVPSLTPLAADLDAVRAGTIGIDEYRRRFDTKTRLSLAPGHITALGESTPYNRLLADGDTLCCACSREAAARGECHRVFAAELLVQAGWRVILDGAEVTS